MGTGGLFLRRLRARVSDEPTGFIWVEKGKLAGSGYPSSRGQLRWLAAQGIDSVLTLTPNPIPTGWADGLNLELAQIPMQDHGVPDVSSLEKAAAHVQERLKAGRSVVVHCLAGEGRTGCVLAAYLIRDRGIGAEEALRTLREVKPEFVERAQERAVYEFAAGAKR